MKRVQIEQSLDDAKDFNNEVGKVTHWLKIIEQRTQDIESSEYR